LFIVVRFLAAAAAGTVTLGEVCDIAEEAATPRPTEGATVLFINIDEPPEYAELTRYQGVATTHRSTSARTIDTSLDGS
jgi:hypothetical protein